MSSTRLAVVLLAATCVTLMGCSASQPLGVGYVGDPYAPSFEATTPTGEQIHFDTTTGMGRQAILLFYKPGCELCKADIPRLTDIYQRRPDVVIIGIPVGQSPTSTETPPFPLLLDPDLTLAARYQVTETPTVVVIEDGRIRHASHRLPAQPFGQVQLASSRH